MCAYVYVSMYVHKLNISYNVEHAANTHRVDLNYEYRDHQGQSSEFFDCQYLLFYCQTVDKMDQFKCDFVSDAAPSHTMPRPQPYLMVTRHNL